jgi:amino acid efflux transporter
MAPIRIIIFTDRSFLSMIQERNRESIQEEKYMKNVVTPTIRLPQAIALYIGAVLGAGILIIPGMAAQIAGPASLVDWALLMLLAFPLSMCMAYLARKYPNSGGVSYFVTKAFGEKTGYLIGWFFLMSVPIGAPVAAITGAGYLSASLGLSENMRILIACLILLLALSLNYIGMSVAGKVQVAVVCGILAILIAAIIGAVPNVKTVNFEPFMTHGALGIGAASTILFWCFIGWEAVSHLSEEFVHPEKDVTRATLISASLIGILYFLSAAAVIGTNSYKMSAQAALVVVAEHAFGRIGAILIGVSALLICLATVVAYIGAASRLALSLSHNGHAPRWFGKVSNKYQTPAGGLIFLSLCFIIIMSLYSMHAVNLGTLIQLPNATFLLTYLGGCAAGVKLFRKDKKPFITSLISLLTTSIMFLFVGWAIIYPATIALFVFLGKPMKVGRQSIISKR